MKIFGIKRNCRFISKHLSYSYLFCCHSWTRACRICLWMSASLRMSLWHTSELCRERTDLPPCTLLRSIGGYGKLRKWRYWFLLRKKDPDRYRDKCKDGKYFNLILTAFNKIFYFLFRRAEETTAKYRKLVVLLE